MVGTSGSATARAFAATAKARSLPSLTSGTAPASELNRIGVWPATVDCAAGAPPLNGTAARSRAADRLNISPERCGVVPMPVWAKLYLPGLALIRSTNSLTVLAGTEGWVRRQFGASAATVKGAKSLSGSYGTFG